MNKVPLVSAQLETVTALQSKLDTLRKSIGVADRGSVLYRSEVSYGEEECIVVEADGLGGAVLRRVTGRYPTDCLSLEEHEYATEFEAVKAAELRRLELAA
jgi:hypothetical protein